MSHRVYILGTIKKSQEVIIHRLYQHVVPPSILLNKLVLYHPFPPLDTCVIFNTCGLDFITHHNENKGHGTACHYFVLGLVS